MFLITICYALFALCLFCNILCLDDVRKTGKIAQLGNYSINNYFYILAS